MLISCGLPFENLLKRLASDAAKNLKLGLQLKYRPLWNYDPYGEYGPQKWDSLFEKCAGSMQSPVNILSQQVVSSPRVEPLIFDNFQLYGTTMQLNFTDEKLLEIINIPPGYSIQSSGLPAKYMLEKIQLHFGCADDHGSEHAMNVKISKSAIF